MTDEEIIAALRATRRLSAVELAELLDDLTDGGLSTYRPRVNSAA